tara:strand:- start:9837 stop:10811 length:975 start_codon:yes stop_codon:yes gene_type:complete
MSAGSKIKDDKQEYQYTIPWVTPGGHEFTFYDTPENERLVIKHASGSRLEFKADGSVFLTAVKDMHTHASILSSQSESAQAADSTTIRYDTDLNLVVQGRLSIKAKSLDLECGEYVKSYAGTDFTIQGNNIIEKATEAISLEGTKAIHVDTKTYTERSVTHTTEEGTKEDGAPGGLSILKVHGNALIQNDDPNGGITIASQGYLNLVAGKERVDLVGRYTDAPAGEAVSTFTQKVFAPAPAGQQDRSTMPGDYYKETTAGASYNLATQTGGSSSSRTDGLQQVVTQGDMTQNVTAGNRERTVGLEENVLIGGKQTVRASQIFLN